MKLTDFFNKITDSVAIKYPISTTTSFFASINWHLWELLLFQILILCIDFARQKYIKKGRQKDLSDARQEVTDMYENSDKKEKIKDV